VSGAIGPIEWELAKVFALRMRPPVRPVGVRPPAERLGEREVTPEKGSLVAPAPVIPDQPSVKGSENVAESHFLGLRLRLATIELPDRCALLEPLLFLGRQGPGRQPLP